MDTDLEKLKALAKAHEFEKALALLSAIESERKLSVAELIVKGLCIQLASGVGTPPLSEVEGAYLEALKQDDEYVPALLELGWFYYAVEDDAERALPLFDRALAGSLGQLKEAIKGKKGCLEEVQSDEAAEEFVRDMVGKALKEEEFSEVAQEEGQKKSRVASAVQLLREDEG
ncbi:MAG TPA: hypothetical protein VGG20_02590 [Thermoanaerobaculia bacterium]